MSAKVPMKLRMGAGRVRSAKHRWQSNEVIFLSRTGIFPDIDNLNFIFAGEIPLAYFLEVFESFPGFRVLTGDVKSQYVFCTPGWPR